MKLKLAFIPLLLLSFCFLFSSKTHAFTPWCVYAAENYWDPITRQVYVCFGGFDSPEDMVGIKIEVKCLQNSSGGFCRGAVGGTDEITSSGGAGIADTKDGSYYMCRGYEGIDRDIGSLRVDFVFPDGSTCSTVPIETKPADYDPLTEGMPWSEDTGAFLERDEFDPYCTPGDKTSGINTALGCIKVDTGEDLIATILRLAMGVGGGLALALILYGVFIVTTSAGMPDKLKAGSEIITSAIIGLIFILLSIFLVNLIGINILGIPGLS